MGAKYGDAWKFFSYGIRDIPSVQEKYLEGKSGDSSRRIKRTEEKSRIEDDFSFSIQR